MFTSHRDVESRGVSQGLQLSHLSGWWTQYTRKPFCSDSIELKSEVLSLKRSSLGSIPIARSVGPLDAVGFTGFRSRNCPRKAIFGRGWTRIASEATELDAAAGRPYFQENQQVPLNLSASIVMNVRFSCSGRGRLENVVIGLTKQRCLPRRRPVTFLLPQRRGRTSQRGDRTEFHLPH